MDHGKTSLVHKLTGVMTDRLPEEQRRGITIELGFAPWRLGDDLMVSVIDAPGHRKLVHHMIAGASGIDLVLLVVAADEGVMPQTREHVAACKLLGVTRSVVAVTKIDRVDRDLAELAAEEALELLVDRGFEATHVLCSSKTGEGIDDLGHAMRSAILATEPARRDRRVRLSVDRVFSVKGAGTVVTGTLVEGTLAVGAPLRILGPARELEANVRGLHVHGEARETASAPTRLAINLAGVALNEVERGDVITDDAHATPTRALDVWAQALEPIRRGSEASIFIGTARSTAKLQPIDSGDALEEGGLARLRLTAPLVALGGDRFVLRGARVDGPAGAVIGGGTVLDVRPPRRVRAAKRKSLLDALHRGDAGSAVAELAAEERPRALRRRALPSRFSIASGVLEQAANDRVSRKELIEVGEGWLTPDALAATTARAVELVAAHHKAAPLEPGIKLQTLRVELSAWGGADAAAEALARAAQAQEIVVEGEHARLPSFRGVEHDEQAARALARADRAVAAAALSGLSDGALAEQLGIDAKQVRAIGAAMLRRGTAIRAGGLLFDSAVVEQLKGQVLSHFEREAVLTIQQFKDLTGLGRKQSIPLLEHFDGLKVTKRQGSERVKG